MKCFKCYLFLFLVLVFPLFARGERNAIIVCENGLETLSWNLELIRHARHSVEIGAYSSGGEVLYTLLEAVADRMEECPEIETYLIISPVLLEEEQSSVITKLSVDYPSRFHCQLTANVPGSNFTGTENHFKCLIVDEHYFSVGGTNFADSFCSEGTITPLRKISSKSSPIELPAGARDADVIGRGPIAKELRQMYHKIYALWESYAQTGYFDVNPEHFCENHYYPVAEGDKQFVERLFETSRGLVEVDGIKLLFSGPWDCTNRIGNEYEKMINSAKSEIEIGNFYFNPQGAILGALMGAVKRGVDATIITNGWWPEGPKLSSYICWASRINYVPLFYGREFHFTEADIAASMPLLNAHIYEYTVKDVLYHKKVMVVDKRYTVIGSYNLSVKSQLSDIELVMIIDSKEVAEQTHEIFERDISFSSEVKPGVAYKWYFDPWTAYHASLQQLFQGIY